jgi:hypothetical protein
MPPLRITGHGLRADPQSGPYGPHESDGGLGYVEPQSACGLCAVFLRYILARRNAAHCFMGGPKLSDYRASGFQTAGTFIV